MFNVISFVNNNSSETKSIITYIVCLFKFFISSRIRKFVHDVKLFFFKSYFMDASWWTTLLLSFFCFKNNFLLIEYLMRWDIYFVRSFSRVLCNLWENFNQLFNRSCFWFFFRHRRAFIYLIYDIQHNIYEEKIHQSW